MIGLAVPTILTITGTNIHNGATVSFDDMEYDGVSSGIEILETIFVDGGGKGDLKVYVLAYSVGSTDVTVRNPNLLFSTLQGALTVA